MRNSEYNNFDEIKLIKEHQVFEPVKTSLYNKETYKSCTESLTTKEYNDSNKKDKMNGVKENKSIVKKLLQKVSEATSTFSGSIAVTAVVAVTSVVIFTSILFKTPNVVLFDLTSGYDYVSYNIHIDEMDENVVYYSVVSNYQEIDRYMLTEGNNSNTIENLTPNTKYDLTVIGIPNDKSNEIEYFKTSFYTKEEANKTKVKWIVEGEVIKEIEINPGDAPIYDEKLPTKEMTIDEEYIFAGWNEEMSDNNEIIYIAMFDVIKHEYTATFNQISKTDVVINYEQKDYYNLSFNTDFDNTQDSRLAYRIILTDILNNEIYQYEGTDKIASINVPISATSLSITYESIGIYNDNVKVYNTTLLDDRLEISVIDFNIDENLNLIGTDIYQLSMQIDTNFENEEIYNSVNLVITFDDSSIKELTIDNVIVNDIMTLDIVVPAYCASFEVAYTIDLLGANGHNQRFITGTKEFMLESSFELLRVYADSTMFMTTRFLFKYHLTDPQTTIAVKDSISTNIVTMNIPEDFIEISLDKTVEQNEYTYYLASLDGQALDTETSVIVNTTTMSGDYTFNYVNPRDAVVTFNDDSTMNVYLNTLFETADSSIWYLIRFTSFNTGISYDIKFTESIASALSIPFDNYGIVYYVYKTIDGIDYQLDYIAVSGGIEVAYDGICDGEIIENEDGTASVSISFHVDSNVLLDSFILIIDGVKHQISQSDIILVDSYYTINYLLDYMPNEISLEFEGSYNFKDIYEMITSVKELEGYQYRKMYLQIL